MSYEVKLMPSAQRDLDNFRGELLKRFQSLILDLERDPRPRNSKKLSGGSGWRLRAGDYRMLYEIDESRKVLKVYRIAHRREVYR